MSQKNGNLVHTAVKTYEFCNNRACICTMNSTVIWCEQETFTECKCGYQTYATYRYCDISNTEHVMLSFIDNTVLITNRTGVKLQLTHLFLYAFLLYFMQYI